MCGIAGAVEQRSGAQVSLDALRRMGSVLAHRGPDAEGFYRSGRAGLAHRRLSIIDLTSGQQPMASADGRVWVAFNGEIYNYLELRAELEARGQVFKTRSDTEVLLAAYVTYGLDAFIRLNGMFACAFWDERHERLVLVRDRFGKKPLFYRPDPWRLVFGSEIKAILAYGDLDRQLDPVALGEYLAHGYVIGESTMLAGIRRLPPAHMLVLERDEVRVHPYWALSFPADATESAEVEVVERVGALIEAAVRRRLVSEVPLGAFLSGGLDSSAAVAMMARLSARPVKTFTIGFEDSDYSELTDARMVARHLGTDHHELIVKPSALDVLPELVWHLDEPFGDSSAVPTYYVCRAAREHVTVAVSGDGGDEVFAGYTRYRDLAHHRRLHAVPDWVRRGVVRPLTNVLPFTAPGWNYLRAIATSRFPEAPVGLGIYPYVLERLATPDLRAALATHDPYAFTAAALDRAAHLDAVSRFQYVDTVQYLPADILTKVDRMSMANSLEVRSPFLDPDLVAYLATLPASLKLRGGVSKYVLRKVCAPLLPASVLEKRKQGFAIPGGRWFQRELRASARDILLDRRTLDRGFFRPGVLTRLLDHHASGRRDYSTWIWCLIVLETWCRMYVDAGARREAA